MSSKLLHNTMKSFFCNSNLARCWKLKSRKFGQKLTSAMLYNSITYKALLMCNIKEGVGL